MKHTRCVTTLILTLCLILAACASEPLAASPLSAPAPPASASSAGGVVTVTFIDVGQGDSTLIRTANYAMLIDGGVRGAYEHISHILDAAGVSHIDYVVATHPHADHIGGLVPLIGNNNGISIGTVLMPNVVHTTRTYENFLQALIDNSINVVEPYPGKVLELDDTYFTVIAPNSSGYGNLNDYSVVIVMDHAGNSFLFAADAERESEAEMLRYFDDISADVLRVGHHGSRTSTKQEFLDAVSPRYAVISAGADNRYGHPHGVVLDRLARHGSRILITFELGDIVMVSSAEGISVEY
ncbi:MAG: MBL fold metallo-hydrolase [Defluviitaleaceae bacterium]|nr:MBL fold metallo-hydrolase [Defluviitaleaceae bacterium]